MRLMLRHRLRRILVSEVLVVRQVLTFVHIEQSFLGGHGLDRLGSNDLNRIVTEIARHE